jgi:hypothetical protein
MQRGLIFLDTTLVPSLPHLDLIELFDHLLDARTCTISVESNQQALVPAQGLIKTHEVEALESVRARG